MAHAQSLFVDRRDSGQTLAAFLKRRLGLTWSETRRRIQAGFVRINGQLCREDVRRVRTGQRISVDGTAASSQRKEKNAAPRGRDSRLDKAQQVPIPQKAPSVSIVHLDDDIVVVEKPPGLTTVRHREELAEFGERAKRYLPLTLADWLPRLLGDRRPVLAVHRLDRDTSGLLVFARHRQAQAELGRQFRAHSVRRHYLAIARGCPTETTIQSHLVADRGDGRRGSSADGTGQRAVTHINVLERLGNFSLVQCRLETGRTHQVRIHLGELGTPICGERVYDRPKHGAPYPDASGARRIALHAAFLGLVHPRTGGWLQWESPLPDDLQELLTRLRKQATEQVISTRTTSSQEETPKDDGEDQTDHSCGTDCEPNPPAGRL